MCMRTRQGSSPWAPGAGEEAADPRQTGRGACVAVPTLPVVKRPSTGSRRQPPRPSSGVATFVGMGGAVGALGARLPTGRLRPALFPAWGCLQVTPVSSPNTAGPWTTRLLGPTCGCGPGPSALPQACWCLGGGGHLVSEIPPPGSRAPSMWWSVRGQWRPERGAASPGERDMGGGASRPWLEQPVMVRPDAEGLLRRNNMQAYVENQHGALVGAGDGRVRVSLPGRRTLFSPEPQRRRQAMTHMRRHRRSQGLPALLLATLARSEAESARGAAASQASAQAAIGDGGGRRDPARRAQRSQDPPDGQARGGGAASDNGSGGSDNGRGGSDGGSGSGGGGSDGGSSDSGSDGGGIGGISGSGGIGGGIGGGISGGINGGISGSINGGIGGGISGGIGGGIGGGINGGIGGGISGGISGGIGGGIGGGGGINGGGGGADQAAPARNPAGPM
ncbi:PE-PGRS family protein PE_PGRS5-like [Antechinus flavipes]|uniref:PE-PGRS family protein PE_PGRS5-like n=1 Tax=Antechinus flavipes TaxID=38775 RepID=UPI002235F49D|nr:PE-PGRS family protein PE_PGRS5-like [Antechinus flavipes]